jgi:hypothetical protein
LGTFARGLIDLNKIRSRWEEILRVVVSIDTGAIRAYDVVTMLRAVVAGGDTGTCGRPHRGSHEGFAVGLELWPQTTMGVRV